MNETLDAKVARLMHVIRNGLTMQVIENALRTELSAQAVYMVHERNDSWLEVTKDVFDRPYWKNKKTLYTTPQPAIEQPEFSVSIYAAPNQSAWFRHTYTGVRVTHKSGAFEECSTERSQHANRTIAFEKLQLRLAALNQTKGQTK